MRPDPSTVRPEKVADIRRRLRLGIYDDRTPATSRPVLDAMMADARRLNVTGRGGRR